MTTPISLEAMAAQRAGWRPARAAARQFAASRGLRPALVRRGARGLRLLGVPVSGFATDLLIGAGCVAESQTSAVSLGEAGFAPRFSAAVRRRHASR